MSIKHGNHGVIDNLIWLDLEMTGLDPDNDRILEIATVITDSELNVIAEGPSYAIYQPSEILLRMDSWNVRQHTGSGLLERVQMSTITEQFAEESTLEFIQQHVGANKSPMCGSTICQDRRFLYRWMPKLERYFHYRNLDVSSVKELARRWMPEVVRKFKKNSKHLALSDVHDSIAELRHYRLHCFKSETNGE